jgi:hypothetical protein
MNEAKAKTVRAGRSEVEQAIRDIAADWPSDCITSAQLQAAVTETLGGRTHSIQAAAVSSGIAKYGWRVHVSGVRSHVWILRNFQEWSSAGADEIAAEVLRGAHADFECDLA